MNMFRTKRTMTLMLTAFALVLTAVGSSDAETILFTPPLSSSFANTGGFCTAVNISGVAHDVTWELFDNNGAVVASFTSPLGPNALSGVPAPNGIGSVYCKITVQDALKKNDSLGAVRGSLCLKEDQIVNGALYVRCIAVVEAR